tara:strand:+ start:2407 stop:2919 length:513 start_codon:yes stop_codon:yes gene_type:complete
MDSQQIERIQQTIDKIGPLVLWTGLGVIVLLILAVYVAICLFLSSCFKRIPEEHRKLKPGLVWLLTIPVLNIVGNFFVYPALAKSYVAAFESQGSNPHGNCGHTLALVYCILVAVTTVLPWIPCLNILGCFNCLLYPAALVIWIIFLIKAGGLKSQISDTRAGVYRDGGI